MKSDWETIAKLTAAKRDSEMGKLAQLRRKRSELEIRIDAARQQLLDQMGAAAAAPGSGFEEWLQWNQRTRADLQREMAVIRAQEVEQESKVSRAIGRADVVTSIRKTIAAKKKVKARRHAS